jgi:hypothetical protein
MTATLTTPTPVPVHTTWTVQDRAWKQDLPDLPDDVIALLAPPVVVSASTTAGRTVPRAVVQVA